ncbi:MAG: flippase [bacterium]
MSISSKQLAKNTSYFTIANILQKIIAFIYFAVISRMIGPDNLGKYTFALSFTAIFAIFIDIGLEKVLIRESAKNLENAQNYFSNALGIKIPLLFLVAFVIFIITKLQPYPLITKQLIYIAVFIMAFDSFILTMECIIRGNQTLKYESISIVSYQVITMIIGIGGLLLGRSIKVLVIALLTASIFRFFFTFIILIKKYKIYPKITYDKDIIKFLLKTIVPFAIAGLFLRIYTCADSILLYYLKGDIAVGFYSVPYRATAAFQFIPMAFVATLLPALSLFYVSSKDLLKRTFEKSLFFLTIISIPISFGIIALSKEIIIKFFGVAYTPSILALQILMTTLFFMFLDFPCGTLLNASNNEKINTYLMGGAMVINIISNLILIPRFGFIGSSVAMIISTLFLMILRMFYSYKVIKFDILHLVGKFFKTLIAGLIMFFGVIYIKSFFNIYITTLIGIFIYCVAILAIGALTTEDIKMVYRALLHKG